jgi:hypothetical protein
VVAFISLIAAFFTLLAIGYLLWRGRRLGCRICWLVPIIDVYDLCKPNSKTSPLFFFFSASGDRFGDCCSKPSGFVPPMDL